MKQSSERSNIATCWFNNNNSKEDFTKSLKGNANNAVLLRLKELVTNRLNDIEAQERTQDYDVASWSHLQAHRNGRKQELQFLLDLLSFTAETKTQ